MGAKRTFSSILNYFAHTSTREASWLVGGLGCVAERGGLGCVAVLLRQRGARSKEAHVLGQGLQSCHQRRMCLDRGGGILLNVLLAPKASPSGVWEVVKSTTKKYYL